MNQYYGKTTDGTDIVYAPDYPDLLSAAGAEDTVSEQALYFQNGWLKIVDDPPAADGKLAVLSACVPDEDAKTLTLKYRLADDAMTADDYDAALEEHLREARTERGYTMREPDTYINSAVPRWKQDAEDWIAFRDQCMLYGLSVINHYAQTGEAPTIEQFKENMPEIQWTYAGE